MRGTFVETRSDDGEKYAGWYGGVFASCQNVFCDFLGENCEIPTQIVAFGDVAKMMKVVRKITCSVRKHFFYYKFRSKSYG